MTPLRKVEQLIQQDPLNYSEIKENLITLGFEVLVDDSRESKILEVAAQSLQSAGFISKSKAVQLCDKAKKLPDYTQDDHLPEQIIVIPDSALGPIDRIPTEEEITALILQAREQVITKKPNHQMRDGKVFFLGTGFWKIKQIFYTKKELKAKGLKPKQIELISPNAFCKNPVYASATPTSLYLKVWIDRLCTHPVLIGSLMLTAR